MKIRNKLLLLKILVCSAIIAVSCSDDNEIDNSGKDSFSGYLSFQLDTNTERILTRGVDDEEGMSGERKVSSVHMLLYDLSSGSLRYNFQIDASTDGNTMFSGQDVVNGGTISPTREYFVSGAKQVKTQDYNMVILVNATADILNKAKAREDYPGNFNTLDDLLTAVKATKPEDYYNDTNQENFFMSNAGGVVYVAKTQLKLKKEDAENAAISVPVERLLAKVIVSENATKKLDNTTLGGKIGAVTWGVTVTNKQTYLVRNQDMLKGGTTESGFVPDRTIVYAQDPNFRDNPTMVLTDHIHEIDIDDATAFLPWNRKDETPQFYKYVLENTQSLNDQLADKINSPKKYTTQVLLKVIITEPATLAGVEDYYSFYTLNNEWKVFTHKQAVEWYANGVQGDQKFPLDMRGLNILLNRAQQSGDFDFTDEDGAPANYTSTDYGLTYHAKGLNVYTIPIKHFGVGDAPVTENDYGYYGVVRNNTYRVIINSINGPGTLTEYENISFRITINEWQPRESDEELKPEA